MVEFSQTNLGLFSKNLDFIKKNNVFLSIFVKKTSVFSKNMFDQSLFSIKKSSTKHFLGKIFPCKCEWIWWLKGPKSLQNIWINF